MKHSSVFEIYQSQLGPLELRINSSDPSCRIEFENAELTTAGHDIVIKKVVPELDWLPPGMRVESTTAWLFYISKRNSSDEQLAFSIELPAVDLGVKCGSATGEHLVAIEFENDFRQMHIGTEDEDAMAYRASKHDYMPQRFQAMLLSYELEITTITACGLCTRVPCLSTGEQFYFHYIVAENPHRKSIDYPDEVDVSTWFAVDQSKNQLEKTWRAQS